MTKEQAIERLKKMIQINNGVIKEARKNGDIFAMQLTADLDTDSIAIETALSMLEEKDQKIIDIQNKICKYCELLSGDREILEEDKETLKKLHIQDNNKLDFVMKHCILEQKIKDKIEELNQKEQKLQNSISAEEREEYSDANISWDLMDINIKREVLQDLIEGRK